MEFGFGDRESKYELSFGLAPRNGRLSLPFLKHRNLLDSTSPQTLGWVHIPRNTVSMFKFIFVFETCECHRFWIRVCSNLKVHSFRSLSSRKVTRTQALVLHPSDASIVHKLLYSRPANNAWTWYFHNAKWVRSFDVAECGKAMSRNLRTDTVDESKRESHAKKLTSAARIARSYTIASSFVNH